MAANKEIKNSYLSIRKLIGSLGFLLPFILVFLEKDFLASISHYYYTPSAVVFIAILFAFGILLISYKGYEFDPKTEKVSDNFITHVGGFAILLVVFIPTKCLDSNSLEISKMCESGVFPLYGHSGEAKWKSIVHLVSAGIFLFSMGWMSLFKFTKGPKTKERIKTNRIYKICGIVIWASIGILALEFLIQAFYPNFYATKIDVFILETVAVIAFGSSWLIKGDAMEDIEELGQKVLEITHIK
jgi:hypothetical protein